MIGTALALSCAAVGPGGDLARFGVVRDQGSLVLVLSGSNWSERVAGISSLNRPDKKTANVEEYRVQTNRGTFVLGFTKTPGEDSPVPVTVEEDIAGVRALNPVRFKGVCVNSSSNIEKAPSPGPATPVTPVGYVVKPITMQNTTFRNSCHLVTPELQLASFDMTVTLGPGSSRFQIAGKPPVPAIDVTGASMAGLVSRIADENRKSLSVFNSAGANGPYHVTTQISGENEDLIQTIEVEQVQSGRKNLVGVGMCGFPPKSPSERG